MNYLNEYNENQRNETIIQESTKELNYNQYSKNTTTTSSITKIDSYYDNNLPYLFNPNFSVIQSTKRTKVLQTKIFLPPIEKKTRRYFNGSSNVEKNECELRGVHPRYLMNFPASEKKKRRRLKLSFLNRKKNRIFPYLAQRTCIKQLKESKIGKLERIQKKRKLPKHIRSRYEGVKSCQKSRKYIVSFNYKINERSAQDLYLDSCLKKSKGNQKVNKIMNIMKELKRLKKRCTLSRKKRKRYQSDIIHDF